MPNIVKEKLTNKLLTIGSWISFGYTPICEIMCSAGFDWLVIDMEHTSIDYEKAQELIQIISLSNNVPLVRVGKNDELIIKRIMDSGAHGVVVPMVNNRLEAEMAVNAVKYPPIGKRGVGLFRAQNYGLGFSDYYSWVQENSIVIVQIEHIDGLNNIDEILSVDGVDGFIIGPYDLSASLGKPGEFNDPEVASAFAYASSKLKDSPKVGGFHVVHSNHELLKSKIEEGFKFIAYGDDMVFFAEKIRDEKSAISNII
ncbi:MAG: hypothetical protein K9J12_17760 [Melioribacteraceae bacterium]|nr:hypothetical protein [Melioribacteraceae bacterium]